MKDINLTNLNSWLLFLLHLHNFLPLIWDNIILYEIYILIKLKYLQNVWYYHLKWYYAQFSLQKLGWNCYLFQTDAIYNDKRQIRRKWQCQLLRLKKNKKMSKHKKTASLFLFRERQIHWLNLIIFNFIIQISWNNF